MTNQRERTKDEKEFYRFVHRAYIKDGKAIHTGEAVLLACMLHVKGKGRNTDDMVEIQRIFRDPNLDK